MGAAAWENVGGRRKLQSNLGRRGDEPFKAGDVRPDMRYITPLSQMENALVPPLPRCSFSVGARQESESLALFDIDSHERPLKITEKHVKFQSALTPVRCVSSFLDDADSNLVGTIVRVVDRGPGYGTAAKSDATSHKKQASYQPSFRFRSSPTCVKLTIVWIQWLQEENVREIE
ncbi:hypothetical protein L210DRAFT_3636102 [Boletus edulis BED1]|uniref:Uncharacterized protein n=1 Tax=Boletus edulis BED1 TaxID=1328754 RepID=A0AAD4BCR3_BOLED|nr:hypothetical protein L210DRAFT_3636102 [Boletus edulis BED1]